jgi:hypothetical protein
MMIRDVLLPMLEQRFPERGLRRGLPPEPIAVFPAIHEAVGDVSIWDDGEEATVGVGTITHGHFNPYDSSLTAEQVAIQVSEDVVGFLEDLFADKVLLWKSPDNASGGWRILGDDGRSSLMDSNDITFLWSGPVRNPLPEGAG